MKDIREIERLITETERELAFLDSRRSLLLEKLKDLKAERDSITEVSFKTIDVFQKAPVTNQSPEAEKISLFRKIFKGREDVYPRRFESRKTGKTGYQPACRNEWLKGVCDKPKIRCSACDNRELLPISRFLDIDPKKIGQIGGGKSKQLREVDVAIIQNQAKRAW